MRRQHGVSTAWWDYASDAAYYITICTAGRHHFFGEITTAPDENAFNGKNTAIRDSRIANQDIILSLCFNHFKLS
jgi:hypothetical protein